MHDICAEKTEYFDIIVYLHKNGVSITKGAIYRASENGHLNIIKYFMGFRYRLSGKKPF